MQWLSIEGPRREMRSVERCVTLVIRIQISLCFLFHVIVISKVAIMNTSSF